MINLNFIIARNLLFLAIIFIFNNLNAQNEISFEIDSIYRIGHSKIKLFKNDERLFYFKVLNNKILINCLDNNLEEIIDYEKINISQIENVLIQGNDLILSSYRKSYFFKKNINGIFHFRDSLSHNYDEIYSLSGGNLLFYNNYNYHPNDLDLESRTKFGVFDLNALKFSSEKKRTFNYYYYTHMISKFVDVSPDGEQIVFSQTLPYSIKIYDKKNNIIQSLSRDLNYDSIPLNKLNFIMDSTFRVSGNVKYFLRKASLNDKYVDRIVKVYYLSDSTLLIIKKMSQSNKNNNERNLDVWVFKNEQWKLEVDNQSYYSYRIYKEGDTFKVNIPFKYSSQVIVHDGYIYCVGPYSPLMQLKNYKELEEYYDRPSPIENESGIYRFKYEIK